MATAADSLKQVIAETVGRLRDADARDEALGQFKHRKGLLGIGAGDRLHPAGRAWRLGSVLVTADHRLYLVGEVTRAVDPRHPNHQSVSGERRREIRRLAYEGDFAVGETVNHGYTEIPLTDDAFIKADTPLHFSDGVVTIDWAPGQKPMPLDRYLAERAELLGAVDGWGEGGATERG